jgi:CRISPR/Cas system-associated endonuclease Cas3-HD
VDLVSYQWFVAGLLIGALVVVIAVVIHHEISTRRKRRRERDFLDTYAKLVALVPMVEETNEELRVRIIESMNPPWARRR